MPLWISRSAASMSARDQGVQPLDRGNPGLARVTLVACLVQPSVIADSVSRHAGPFRRGTLRTAPKPAVKQPAGLSRRGAISVYTSAMRVVLKTNNPVVLSYATHVLEEAGIAALVFDTHASIMDGSMAMVPRRLMVPDEDFNRAESLLRASGAGRDAVSVEKFLEWAGDRAPAGAGLPRRAGCGDAGGCGAGRAGRRRWNWARARAPPACAWRRGCRAWRSPAWRSIPAWSQLANDNAAANRHDGAGALHRRPTSSTLPPALKRDYRPRVLTNPPFHGEGQVSPDAGPGPRPDGRGRLWATGWRRAEAHHLRRHASPPSCGPTGWTRRWRRCPDRRQRLPALAASGRAGQAGDRAGPQGLRRAFLPAARPGAA